MSDQTPKEYWERTGDSFTEIKVLKRTVATLTARCEALEQDRNDFRDEVHTLAKACTDTALERDALRVRCEGLTAERDKRGEMITHVTDATLEAMERYGGSFVRQLATLYRVSDPDNQAILRHAFGILFAQYAGMAELAKRQD